MTDLNDLLNEAKEAEKEEKEEEFHPTLAAFKEAMEGFNWDLFLSQDTKQQERARKRFAMQVASHYVQAKKYHPKESKKIWNANIRPPYSKEL